MSSGDPDELELGVAMELPIKPYDEFRPYPIPLRPRDGHSVPAAAGLFGGGVEYSKNLEIKLNGYFRVGHKYAYGIVLDGYTVFDFDHAEALESWIEQFGDVETFTVKSPRGWHYYFKGEMPTCIGLVDGLDIKSTKSSFVFGPGSRAVKQSHGYLGYKIFRDKPVLPIWEALAWREGVYSARRYTDRTEPFRDPLELDVDSSTRNVELTRYLGVKWNSRGFNAEELLAVALQANTKFTSPLPESEVRTIAASVSRRPINDDKFLSSIDSHVANKDAEDKLLTPSLEKAVRQRAMDKFMDSQANELAGKLKTQYDTEVGNFTFGSLVTDANEFIKRDTEIDEWYIPGILPKLEKMLMYGAPGSKKTFVAAYLAMHMATGIPVPNSGAVTPIEQRKVLYLLGEGENAVAGRLQGFVAHHKNKLTEQEWSERLSNLKILPIGGDLETILDVVMPGLVEQDWQPDLVVVDTLNMYTVGGLSENDSGMGSMLLAPKKWGADVLVIHHTRKEDNEIRGSSAIKGAMDFVALVSSTEMSTFYKVVKNRASEWEDVTVEILWTRTPNRSLAILDYGDRGSLESVKANLRTVSRISKAKVGRDDKFEEFLADLHLSFEFDSFTRAEVLELGLTTNIVDRYLKIGVESGRIVKPERGLYSLAEGPKAVLQDPETF